MNTDPEAPLELQLARCYRTLFMYETDPEADWAPAWLTSLGQLDCLSGIRLLEAAIAESGKSHRNGLE